MYLGRWAQRGLRRREHLELVFASPRAEAPIGTAAMAESGTKQKNRASSCKRRRGTRVLQQCITSIYKTEGSSSEKTLVH